MPQQSVDNNLIIQFADLLHVRAQQIRARWRPFVRIKQMTGDVYAYDGLGSIEAQEVQGRVQPTVFNEIEHNRRKIRRRRFVVTLPIDDSDVRALLIDPESEYAEACIRAMERVFDRVGAEAVFADVETGRDFATTITAINDGVVTVDATAGLTYPRLLEIKENFIDNDVGTDLNEVLVFSITGEEHTALMQELELISGDFSRQFVVDRGEIVRAVGMEIVVFAANAPQPIINVRTGSVRENIAFAGRGLCYGISKDMTIKIQDRPDFIDTKQVQITGILGAVRTEGVLVQQVDTTAT